jgi:hypothetical protein
VGTLLPPVSRDMRLDRDVGLSFVLNYGVDGGENCVKASSAWLAYMTDGPAPM